MSRPSVVSIAAPAMTDADQPRPSSVRPMVICRSEPPDVPATATATMSVHCPSRIVRAAPQRSLIQPMTGDNANIPAMCRLIVRPMICNDEPWSSMCTGVSAMTDTITAWDEAMA